MKTTSDSKSVETVPFAASFSASDLELTLKPTVRGKARDIEGSISTDSRTIKPGQWYLALKGENFDGHRFVDAAIKGGAAGCIVSSPCEKIALPDGVALYQVSDTLTAYHALAKSWLNKVKPFVIAVTGSSGKTTTKEMCAAVVSSVAFHKSAANENNEFGLPKTILSMRVETKVLVAEMGMRGLKQIALLAETATPDAAIITGVGTAHIELLGSVENIIKAKCEIFEEMHGKGLAIIGNPTDDLVNHARSVFGGEMALFDNKDLKETSVTVESTRFTVNGFDGEFEVHAHGIRHLQDAWCAMQAARAAGIDDQAIADGLRAYRSVEGRGSRIVLQDGTTVIDEAYNANPDSVKCAIESVLDQRAYPQSKKFIVLGEMAELGENSGLMHVQVGEWLKQHSFTSLITVGSKAVDIALGARGGSYEIVECEEQDDALAILKERKTGKDTCIMVKGSHCANLDRLVANLAK